MAIKACFKILTTVNIKEKLDNLTEEQKQQLFTPDELELMKDPDFTDLIDPTLKPELQKMLTDDELLDKMLTEDAKIQNLDEDVEVPQDLVQALEDGGWA
jgi:hypothetical protein